jgi:hypothetical protein
LRIFISASASDEGFTLAPVHLFTVWAEEFSPAIVVEVSPEFKTPLMPVVVAAQSAEDEFKFALPEIDDEDPASVNVAIVSHYNSSIVSFRDKEITFTNIEKSDNLTLQVLLTDNKGNKNMYNWNFEIKALNGKNDEVSSNEG